MDSKELVENARLNCEARRKCGSDTVWLSCDTVESLLASIQSLTADLARVTAERDAMAIELQVLNLAIANHAAAQDTKTPF